MRILPKISELRDAILKEHSEEDFKKVLKQLRETYTSPKTKSELDILLNSESLSPAHENLLPYLIFVCRILKVKIPYKYIHYPDNGDSEKVKKDKEARDKARPPKINYEEEIIKIRKKYQMKIQKWCEGKTHFETCYTSFKRKEFNEIIDLYLARIIEPHKPLDEDGGRPPYVVWSLDEISRERAYIPDLPEEIRDGYHKLIDDFFKRHLSGESLDYQVIAGKTFSYFQNKIYQYDTIVGWGK